MRYPGWYAWAAVVLSTMASAGLSAVVSVQLAERAVQAQQESQQQAAEASRQATCNVVRTQLAIYEVAPPSTATGREAVAAWGDMKNLYRCT